MAASISPRMPKLLLDLNPPRQGKLLFLRCFSRMNHFNFQLDKSHSRYTLNLQFATKRRRQYGFSVSIRQLSLPQHNATLNQSPFHLVSEEINRISSFIKKEVSVADKELESISTYHFDGKGKLIRPTVSLLMARACNHNNTGKESHILQSQYTVAAVAEMIHTASLMHDDVIDRSDLRRGKASIHNLSGPKKAVLAGDYVIARASVALARIGNPRVVEVLSTVLEDLIRGEFMQLGSKENEDDRFNHYLKKTFKKTASLFANSCKAVAILANSSSRVEELAYQYGKNIGLAFQLVDDILDFVSSEKVMGKPACADLHQGIATAPVLFAADKVNAMAAMATVNVLQFPELHAMIMRRFAEPGDVEKAFNYVQQSEGLESTRMLAERHGNEAVKLLSQLSESVERSALVTLTQHVLSRIK